MRDWDPIWGRCAQLLAHTDALAVRTLFRRHFGQRSDLTGGGARVGSNEVVAAVADWGIPLVELTGGEPLLQPAVPHLLTMLLDRGHTVLVETSGAVGLAGLDARARLIVDVKTPASGEHQRHRWADLPLLKPGLDELKFVLVDEADYAWAVEQVRTRPIPAGVTVLFSPAANALSPSWLAERIVADRLPVRFQVQLHKVLWGDRTGV